MSGPVASNLVLLSDLETTAQGTKVRFLGCVDEYVVQTATLRLKHNYPAASHAVIANVDVVHVLERIKTHEMEVGTWINVIGYVERRKERGVFVQAIAIWSAGNVDVGAYERAVDAKKTAG
ncbi:CST complex subunit Ten1 [Boeremia exigua]|uniref:CST complex subunit Ten1 n=1 Tax=Boeremia exigua TaxID=749465 RepID=UPI001E8DEFF6|nr:CST complex subunit Ten1 [Boeremia exigua]KAH6621930.1 CST complex subunit Ten1 [Boeremia exigua]